MTNKFIEQIETSIDFESIINRCTKKNGLSLPIIFFGKKDDVSKLAVEYLIKNDKIIPYAICDEGNYDEITQSLSDFFVMTMSRHTKNVIEFLKSKGYKNKILLYDGLTPRKVILDKEFIYDNINKFEEVYNMFEDDYSKRVYTAFINAKLTRDCSYTYPLETWGQYTEKGIVSFKDKKVFVDCGCYLGEDIIKFSNEVKNEGENYKRIISFEPNPVNYKKAMNFVKDKQLKNVELYNIAVSDKKGLSMFTNNIADSWACLVGGGEK